LKVASASNQVAKASPMPDTRNRTGALAITPTSTTINSGFLEWESTFDIALRCNLSQISALVNELLQEINCIVFSLREKYCLYDYFAFPE